MPYSVTVAPRAAKGMRTLPLEARARIVQAIDALADNPRPPGCKAMHGALAGAYRIRVGTYRVVYDVNDAELRVLVVRVANRREVYR